MDDDDGDGRENVRQRKKIGCGRENAMDGKSIMDQERPLLAFLSSLGRQAMVIHYNGTEINSDRSSRKAFYVKRIERKCF